MGPRTNYSEKNKGHILWDLAYTDGLMQGCSNSIANAQRLLQSCTSHRYNLSIENRNNSTQTNYP